MNQLKIIRYKYSNNLLVIDDSLKLKTELDLNSLFKKYKFIDIKAFYIKFKEIALNNRSKSIDEEGYSNSQITLDDLGYPDLDYHVYCISNFLTLGHDDFGYDLEQSEIISYVSFPQAIESINYNIRKFSSSLGFCHHADNHLINQENYESDYILNMMRLNFTVVSLESLIYRFLGGNRNPKKIILSNLTSENINISFIKNFSRDLKFIQDDLCNEFYFGSIFNINEKGELKFSEIKKSDRNYELALSIIYKIRNKFIHGIIAIPSYVEDKKQKENEIKILNLLQRLVLYFIQILIYINYKDEYPIVQWEGDGFPIKTVMQNLHIDITYWQE